MNNQNRVLIISGPTACGKTALALKLKELTDQSLEIVNFDSLLFYQDLDIGTAKPTPQEQKLIPHHLISIRPVNQPLNAADFSDLALETIAQIHQRQNIAVLVGGSGFYLRALIKGMYNAAKKDEALQERIQTQYEQEGISPIREYLKDHDPESFQRLHENDHYRIMCAYEYHLQTGEKFSAQKQLADSNDPYDFTTNRVPDWHWEHIYLNIAPEQHWSLIEKRTEIILKQGLIAEVQGFLNKGFSGQEKPLQSIGYKEAQNYLKGDLKSEDQLKEAINISTRQLAKAQRTFFNKITPKKTFHPIHDEKNLHTYLAQWFRL